MNSLSKVASAAPLKEYFGIRIKFRKTFANAPATITNEYCFCFPHAVKGFPNSTFTETTEILRARIFKAIEAEIYSCPKIRFMPKSDRP